MKFSPWYRFSSADYAHRPQSGGLILFGWYSRKARVTRPHVRAFKVVSSGLSELLTSQARRA
jgi:hypothetical protein